MYIDSCDMACCCGAIEIGRFGGGESGDDDATYWSVREIKAAIKDTLKTAKNMGVSVAYATTMSNQPNASKALEQLGFYTTEPYKLNPRYRDVDDRTMQSWFLPLVEFKSR